MSHLSVVLKLPCLFRRYFSCLLAGFEISVETGHDMIYEVKSQYVHFYFSLAWNWAVFNVCFSYWFLRNQFPLVTWFLSPPFIYWVSQVLLPKQSLHFAALSASSTVIILFIWWEKCVRGEMLYNHKIICVPGL